MKNILNDSVNELDKPDLNKMWRTWVKIGLKNQLSNKMFQDTIRHQMYNILQLQKIGEISWFYFLIHDKSDDSVNAYFDTVFTTDRVNPSEFLPEYCIDTKKIFPMIKISGIDSSILKDGDIVEAWKIIGEQSEFIIDLVCAHVEDSEIPKNQITQFMHFFMNSLGLGNKSILFYPNIPPQIIMQIQLMPEKSK